MFLKLLQHSWLSVRRSSVWTQSVVQNIFLGLFAALMLLYFLALGFVGGTLIEQFFPNENPLNVINRFLIYYVLTDIIIRFMMQRYPSLDLKNYLILNIKKSSLAKHITAKSLFSFFNIAPFFFIIPFYFVVVSKQVTGFEGLSWLLIMTCIVFINHFIAFLIDKNLGKNTIIAGSMLAIVGGLLFLDHKGFFSLSTISQPFFDFLFGNPWTVGALIAVIVGLFFSAKKFLQGNAYLDDLNVSENKVSKNDFGIFNYFGPKLGRLLKLEAKLIWRNKRPKAYFWMSVMFLFYPLVFISGDSINSNVMLIFIGLFVTGSLSLNHGQLMLSWNSEHFDFILAQNIKLRDYLNAKFTLLALSNVVVYFLSVPYLFFYPKVFYVGSAMVLYNTGFTIFCYMFLSFNYSKRIEINKKGAFNTEGFGAAQYLVILPILLVPIIVYLVFRAFDQRMMGFVAIGIIGLIGILFKNQILDKAAETMQAKKYTINSNFKK